MTAGIDDQTVTGPRSEGSARGEVLARAVAAAQDAGTDVPGRELAPLLSRFYRFVADQDLVRREPADHAGAGLSHHAFARRRPAGTALVRTLNPTPEQDGWGSRRTVVEVVTDDMPFLVDSVTAELERRGHEISLVVHPAFVVRRDGEGSLVEVLDASASALPTGTHDESWPDDALVESWMHLEIDREGDADALASIDASIVEVLADVRASVEDWAAMRQVAVATADGLDASPPEGLAEEAGDAARLLRWLADDNFTFLGYREYVLDVVDEEDVLRAVPGTGLGTLRTERTGRRAAAAAQEGRDDASGSFARLPREVRARARQRQVLILTKANSRATVHRPVYLDYVGIKTFDASGAVTGERRFLGLFASVAYTESVRQVPVLDVKSAAVMARSGFAPDSHSGKDLHTVLETYPRDELFQMSVDQLYDTAMAVVRLHERRRTLVFLRPDEYGRFESVVVYLPRDRYNTVVRLRVQSVLEEAFGAQSSDWTTNVNESVLARIHFTLRMAPGRDLPDVDAADLQRRVAEATRTWEEDLADALDGVLEEEHAAAVRGTWGRGLPEAYKEDFTAADAVGDLRRLDELWARVEDGGPDASAGSPDGSSVLAQRLVGTHLYRPRGGGPLERRLKLLRVAPLSLTAVLPILRNLGAEVVDERPYHLERADGSTGYVYDFGLRLPVEPDEGAAALLTETFRAAWDGRTESDELDQLVLLAGLTWRQVVVLRACSRYLRQAGSTFSQEYLVAALVANASIARALVELFEARLAPVGDGGPGGDGAEASGAPHALADGVAESVRSALDDVVSLDHDRILRSFLTLVLATLRTNAFQHGDDGQPKAHVALKLDPRAIPDLPAPRPTAEVWVYSPRVEGVHLRFGAVARGGLRWSDRREDFRTEVLGLVKAQTVKNAVIVPTGAKGGFVAKQLPDPAVDREAWMAEGLAAYRVFIHGLLDVTDNLVPDEGSPGARRVVPPPGVVRRDGDDTYLVVAADKGTASFSDTANAIAAEHDFWLGDAFASGGSAGYDHKAMAITARGAWTSVRHHFRALGLDTQSEDFRVVGVGDMSGDVFGNGMLLSRHIRLVAAFDHRHVFVDPEPDAATSFTERQRLFDLPRSSWADYDTALHSEGGGVWPTSAKSITLPAPALEALGLPADTAPLTPSEVVSAILCAPVDLLWNGGIGTYVKASSEGDAEVGDRANDPVRVDGRQLRTAVVGEGGNLGFTQRGRVEAAMSGVIINTDAIDNSAGVDCSDHEVNIKVLLADVIADGELSVPERDELLVAMTDEVADLVLADNEAQNVLLSTARAQAETMLPVHRRLIAAMESAGDLDREVEELPSDTALAARGEQGRGLTVPELAVVTAYSKNTLKASLLATSVGDDPAFTPLMAEYFPRPLVDRYEDRLTSHPLRREIITNSLVNDVVNRAGATFVHRLVDESGTSEEHAVRSWAVCRAVFDVAGHAADVDALATGDHDASVDAGVITRMRLDLRRLVDRASRWFVQHLPDGFDIAAETERFRPVVERWSGHVEDLLGGQDRVRFRAEVGELTDAGVPESMAHRSVGLLWEFALLDITESASTVDVGTEEAAPLYFALFDRYGADVLLVAISALGREDRWEALARAALREDVYAVMAALTSRVLTSTDPDAPTERVAAWESTREAQLARVRRTLAEVHAQPSSDLAPLSVALRLLRGVVASGSA